MSASDDRPEPAGDRVFAGAVPELYERLMVPLIFAPYAEVLAARVAELAPRRLLETAAGTGAVTRRMAAVLAQDARIVATDLNPAMLEVGARVAPEPCISWQQADALALPFAEAGFDAVVCAFGLMFFPDRVRGLAEARRVLVPGGTLLLSVWDTIATNLPAAAVTQALAAEFPDDPPLFLARTPHGHSSLDRLRAEMAEAGFATFAAEVVTGTAHAAALPEVAAAFCQGTPLRAEIEQRAPGRLGEVTARVADALLRRFGPEPVDLPLQALLVRGRR
ncbi:methyltransferase domain-containing protein [Ancylobacter sp. 6x-1]|uniref:Methyltransferase domain-containing protein n=1 Tax=Ancylobacter crimeensis TaxID=2579147 RepID=A0ABT0D9F6_9HYPH|nr:methyltransferase domain-containing protein [Ancylobacter crimeensis]MCK0196554.1 methyltransferase domain-containing protein [Ancylobacter crimeensis]